MRAAVLAIPCFLVTAVGVASAQTPLLRGLASPAVTQPLLREGVSRVRAVDADVAALRAVHPAPVDALASAASTVTLELFPDVQVAVALIRRDSILPDGAVTFAGSIVGEADGRAISLAVVDGTLAVDVILPGGALRSALSRRRPPPGAAGRRRVHVRHGAYGRRRGCGRRRLGPRIAEPVFEGPPVVVERAVWSTRRARRRTPGAPPGFARRSTSRLRRPTTRWPAASSRIASARSTSRRPTTS